jgi:putative ABC transport system ATP-binding protein
MAVTHTTSTEPLPPRPPAVSLHPQAVVSTRALAKTYGSGDAAVHALAGVDLDIAPARFSAVMGPSGSGKSTLVHLMAGLDTPTSGSVLVDGVDLARLSDRKLTQLRRDRLGFVFQSFNLVPTLDARENIELPSVLAGRTVDRRWFDRVVRMTGLGDRLRHRPAELSGGQQQRVAVARALAAKPAVVFADEPTGNLDSRSGADVLGFLRDAVDTYGQTIVMVTHDPNAASYADEVVFLADGRVVDLMPAPTTARVLERMKVIGG